MLQEVVLPQLGQTMEEGTIEKWHKSEGDEVEKGEVLFELTTDKATLEVESFAEGILKKILVPEGETVPVNELVAVIGDADDEVPDDLSALKEEAGEEEAAATGEADSEAEAEEAPAAGAPSADEAVPQPTGRIFASPRARKIAEEQEIPLSVLSGSGPNGRIIERDVQSYREKREDIKFTPTAARVAFQKGVDLLAVEPSDEDGRITREDVEQAATAAPTAGERIELTAMRQTIAERMTQSKQTIPHFYLVGNVNMQRTGDLRDRLNEEAAEKVSFTALLVKAAAISLRDHPRVNAQFDDGEIVLNEHANIGVAVAVEDGLFVPVVKDADRLSIPEISSQLKELVELSRAGKLRPDQYEGGSLTLSNLGMFGVEYFIPIINPPESCIMGIGEMGNEVVARDDGSIAVEPRMKISLSADHRIVDGAAAAQFFQTFKSVLEGAERLE